MKGTYKMKSFYYLSVILGLLCSSVNGQQNEGKYGIFKTKEKLHEYKEKVYKESNRHNFSFSGYIVDDKGNPLNDVDMDVKESYSAWSIRGRKHNQMKSNGSKFNMVSGRCRSASIKFTKQGYYPAYVNASYLDIMTPNMKYDFQYDGETIYAADIKVEMVEVGDLPPLIRWLHDKITCEIVKSEGGREHSIYGLKVPGTLYNREKSQYFKVNDLKKLPKDLIYVFSDELNNNVFNTKQALLSKKELVEIKIPTSIIMATNDTNGGFILVPGTNDKYQFRKMREAPTDGYRNKLKLTDFIYNNGNLKHIYFYFKVNDCYGKGYILDLLEMDNARGNGGMETKLGIEYNIQVNPTPNDRNVNSYEQ